MFLVTSIVKTHPAAFNLSQSAEPSISENEGLLPPQRFATIPDPKYPVGANNRFVEESMYIKEFVSICKRFFMLSLGIVTRDGVSVHFWQNLSRKGHGMCNGNPVRQYPVLFTHRITSSGDGEVT